MPKAAVDEDGEFAADKGDVGSDGSLGEERTTPSAEAAIAGFGIHPSLVSRGA